MRKTGRRWLVLDCNFLCHRAYHALGDLHHEGEDTGALFGFFRDLINFQNIYNTTDTIFCFDVGTSHRREVYPEYKANREKDWDAMPEEEYDSRMAFYSQVNKLRKKYLPFLGYNNIFTHVGYEADDCIAAVCQWKPPRDEIIIISSDQDLYQLLRKRISIYNPAAKRTITDTTFVAQYGILPSWWPRVKAIAGCPTDNVRGVYGVGEMTAIKFLKGQTKDGSKKHDAIVAAKKQIKRNLKLVKLPYEGCKKFVPARNKLHPKFWEQLAIKLGMTTLLEIVGTPPPGVRQRRG